MSKKVKLQSEYILALKMLPGFSNRIVNYLIDENANEIRTVDDLCAYIKNKTYGLKALYAKIAIPTIDQLQKNIEDAYAMLKKCEKDGISMITIQSDEYPKNLHSMRYRPTIFFVKGNKELLLQENMIAVIGTRKPSHIAIEYGKRLVKKLVANGYIIVSGLALGCDTIAHTTCIEHDGRTIAVMPCGVDQITPKENEALYYEILKCNGLILSEYPIGVRPKSFSFLERDKIIAGLSKAVCIIETDTKGGSMHTALQAREQGKLLACIDYPEPLRGQVSADGNVELIRNGAYKLSSDEDIERFMNAIEGNKR